MNEKQYIDPNEWFIKYSIEITLPDSENFLKVAETLTRIGIANYADKTLTQSCHLLSKGGKYYVVHFKEMLALDGKPVNIDDEDILRRNRIITLLEEWKLIDIIDIDKIHSQALTAAFTIIPFKDKKIWNLKTKYQIGLQNQK